MKLAVNVGPEFGHRGVERGVTQSKRDTRHGMANTTVGSRGQCRCRLAVDTAWQQDQDQPKGCICRRYAEPSAFSSWYSGKKTARLHSPAGVQNQVLGCVPV